MYHSRVQSSNHTKMANIPYIHKKNPRSKSLRISVSGTGDLVVSSPPYTPKILVDRFVQTNSHWIELQKRKIESKQSFTLTDTTLAVFGKTYKRKDIFSKKLRVGLHVSGEEVLFNAPYAKGVDSAEKITAAYHRNARKFLQKTAKSYIIPRTALLAKKMGISYGEITLKEQKTRWGSCSSIGNLNFNWRLVHFEPPIIDYVIIHELAHRVHMNHSSDFWKLVETYDPEYKMKRGWLKRNGLSVS